MDRPKCWVKNAIKTLELKVKVGLKFLMKFLTQHIFYPNLGSNNPAVFRVY